MDKIEIINFSQIFVSEFKKYKIDLDYSLESLNKIEDYLNSTFKNAKPKSNSFFYEDTESKCFGLGAYLGEVIRKNGKGVRWNNKAVDSVIGITLETPDGSTAFTINKAFKRIHNGPEDNIYHFASVIIPKLNHESEIPADFYDKEDLRIEKYEASPLTKYSKAIQENNGIVSHVYHENGKWYFSSSEEAEKNAANGNYELMFLEEVKLKHPEFADLLIAEDKLRIVRQGDGSYRTQKQHKGPFYDSHTIPTYQGDMKLNILQWTKYNFSKVIKPLLALLLGFLLMTKVHWIFALLFIGALLYTIWYWFTAFNKFKGGDMNPGKVISVTPTLIAVASDMRKFSGDYPILKIIEAKLPKEDLELHKIIPTIALYNDNPHGYPFWAEFHPVPVVHGIKDKNHINSILSNFSETDIQTLNDYIDKAGTKAVGIYKLDETTSNWSAYKHVDISKGISLEGPIDQTK